MQKILYFSISLHIPSAWSHLFINHKIACSINANERVCAAFNSIHSLMMIAGGDSFQLWKADGASAVDACRHCRCVSNYVDFVGFLFCLSSGVARSPSC